MTKKMNRLLAERFPSCSAAGGFRALRSFPVLLLTVLLLTVSSYASELTVGDLVVTNDATIHGQINVGFVDTNGGGLATGGTITTNGGYIIHTFTNVGTANFIVSGGPLVCDVLVVAGGGAGQEAGGGAGGVLITNGSIVAGTYTVNVGNGGAGGMNNGENSVFGAWTAIGGGYGQAFYGDRSVGSGGSGGGGFDAARGGAVGSGTPGQGYEGGLGFSDQETFTVWGGGGGAGEPGHAGTPASAGNGGDGRACNFSGTSVYYGGGGGGVSGGWQPGGMGGNGGGGIGADSSRHGTDAQANTGGGGGGNGLYVKYYAGGSGVVIVRYPISGAVAQMPTLTISTNGIRQASASATNVFLGKVGIGTESPAEKLHVAGDVKVEGALTIGGETRTNWPSGGGVAVGALIATNNLADLTDAAAARTNLGLGSAATEDAAAFDAAGTAAAVGSSLATHTGDFSNPHKVTAAQVDALTATGNGSQLTGITAEQVGALSINGGTMNGAIFFPSAFGDIPMGVYTNQ